MDRVSLADFQSLFQGKQLALKLPAQHLRLRRFGGYLCDEVGLHLPHVEGRENRPYISDEKALNHLNSDVVDQSLQRDLLKQVLE